MSLSVIILTRNEAANIQACLDAVSFADERWVIDAASDDDTVRIARTAGAQVVQTTDWPGFGAQRNRALAQVQTDWVLFVDADERVSPALAAQIQQAMQQPRADVYAMPRLTNFCGSWIRHCGWTPDHVTRLFRRGQAVYSDDLVHERLVPQAGAREAQLQSPLLHFSYPTPAHYWRKLQSYSDAWAQQRHQQGQTTSMARACVSAVVAFVRSYFFRLGFLDGAMGLAVCTMQSQATFAKYFTLYCLSRTHAD